VEERLLSLVGEKPQTREGEGALCGNFLLTFNWNFLSKFELAEFLECFEIGGNFAM
jgi:hypothetical protein